ncbi:MAG: peptidoglycan DD-metalloendopeptidase family protein [Bacteroidaceae bacterium]|nr:peptidoglycan DD-metalloendopeptidase family protein [Bacteroidaceae bacterium]
MFKRIALSLIILFFAILSMSAQSLKEMKQHAADLQKQIAEKEVILRSSQKDVKSKLQNLDLITAQINERKKLIGAVAKEVRLLNNEIARLDKEVANSEKDVEKARDEYSKALRRALRYGSFQDKLLFIMSANDFNTMLRRYRYTREYMNAHVDIANRLKEYIHELEIKRAETDSLRADKEHTLKMQTEERKKLEELEKEQRSLVAELRRESNKVQRELNKQRKQLTKLNNSIEREIERELAAKKAREKAAKHAKGKDKSGKQSDVADIKINDEEVRKMSGSFVQNKGKLPVPITGPYHLVNSFGPQKGVAGKGNVKIDYGGITLQGAKGARARCVFDGKVTSVVRSDDLAFVIVRHGEYLTVYCRVDNIRVKEGDKVKAGDVLADIAIDATGHARLLFQLRKEKAKLNPMQWLKM